MSARAAAYQTQISGRAAGEVYLVDGVNFDAFRGGTLLDAKGPGYATFTKDGRFREFFQGAEDLLSQAARQVRAAGKTSIEWHVAEREAADAITTLLREAGYSSRINVVFTPPVP